MGISCCQKKRADSAAGTSGRKTWRKRFWNFGEKQKHTEL